MLKLPEHSIINEAIHELWSLEVWIGEFSANSMGRVGDVHPTVVPAAAVIRVAVMKMRKNLVDMCLTSESRENKNVVIMVKVNFWS